MAKSIFDDPIDRSTLDFPEPPLPTPVPAPTAPKPTGVSTGATSFLPSSFMGGGGPPSPAVTVAPTVSVPTPTPSPSSFNVSSLGISGGPPDVKPNLPEPPVAVSDVPNCPPGLSTRACQSWRNDPRYSPAQWAEWDQFYDPSCPASAPYHSLKNIGGQPVNGCVGKPDDCPAGYQAWGRNDECVSGNDPRVGGGGGGGGGPAPARGPAAPAIGPSQQSANFAKLIEDQLRADLAAPSRYTPEALQALYGEIARQSAGSIRRGEAAVRADAARRNMSRAGIVGAAIRGVHDVSEQQRGQAIVGVQTQKINADFTDKQAALDRAQKYLDSLRDNEYRYMLTAEQRRQFDANLTLAYANLSQQRSMFNAQLQSQWDMLRAQQGFNLLNQGA